MLIGLAPGEEENRQGKAFCGPSGQLLRLLCEMAGVRPADIYLANAIRCHPPGNRRPKIEEMRHCRPYLIEEIQTVAPLVIVTLGDVALQAAYGRATTLGSVLGQTLTQPETGIPLIPSYHPAFLLRGQWQVADVVKEHFEKALRIANGELGQPRLGEYLAVTDLAQLHVLHDYLLHSDTKELAFDTETMGLDWRKDELLCISFSTEAGEGFVVPLLSHKNVPQPEIPKGRKTAPPWAVDSHWTEEEWPEVLRLLREIFASETKKVGQNVSFDLRFLERRPDWPFVSAATAFGFEVNGVLEDTMLLHHAVAEAAMPPEARRTKRSSLAILTAIYSDLPYYEEEITQVTSNKRKMTEAPDELLWKYSAADADAVLRIAPPLREKARKEGTLWASEQIIQPLVRCCWEMEKRGVLVDMDYFNKLCAHYAQRVADAEERLWAVPLPETKPGWKYLDYKSLQRVLFSELKLPSSGYKTDSGRGCEACDAGLCFEHEQTGHDALQAIQSQSDHPIIPILLELKELRKAQGTYLDGGRGGFLRHIEADGRIRSQYRVGGAETSRLSSAEPNMQNIPKDVVIPELKTQDAFRRMFTAPAGFGLMTADWGQAEVWGLAYMAGDEALLQVLMAGRDVHTYIARGVWPIDPELSDMEWRDIHADLRRAGKTLVFGIGYGLTDEGIAERLNCSVEEAGEVRARYMRVVASLPTFFSQARRDVIERGYRENIFGQRRHFPPAALLKAVRRYNDLEGLIREGINYPIQSGCSTLHSAAHRLSEFHPALRKRQCYPVISVHDSITFEFYWPDNAYAEQTARIIKELWEETAKNLILPDGSRLGWQIPVDIEFGKTWGDPLVKLMAKGDILEV
jgi:DNA polymerase-1